MRFVKTLALAAVFAAGTSAVGFAEDAAPDSIANQEPVFGTGFDTAAVYAPQTVTSAGPLQVQASQWIADRFNPNRPMTAEERFFFRMETANAGDGSGGGD